MASPKAPILLLLSLTILNSCNPAYNCPQIDVPLEDYSGNEFEKSILNHETKFGDWDIKSKSMVPFTIPGTGPGRGIPCVKGSKEGENLNYWYCGFVSKKGDFGITLNSQVPYIEQTLISPSGEIGETVRKRFTNIYDKDGHFLRTECFPDPIEQQNANFKAIAEELIRGRN